MLDFNEMRSFVTALTGSPDSLISFQTFYDPKPPAPQRPELAATWFSDITTSVDFITHRQQNQCGIYMCINGTDGKGREIENVTDLRVIFADFDGQTEPQWTLTPHLVQKRDDTHGHAFWLIDGSELTHDDWSKLQRQVAVFYGTDRQVIDPCRVVRLPGTGHYKDPANPKCYNITSNLTGSGHRYSVSDIKNAHILSASQEAENNQWYEARKGILTGTGFERSDVHEAQFTHWLTNTAPVAIEGNGTFTVIKVAAYAYDRGIPLEVTQELMWQHYNSRCLPPWQEHEKRHFDQTIHHAYRYAVSAPGCKTTKAVFNELPPLPEPVAGWEENAQINEAPTVDLSEFTLNNRINKDEAILLGAQLTPKAAHVDFAKVYDGVMFNGNSLIRCDKIFYRYNGRSWKEVGDDVIKAQITNMFIGLKVNDATVSSVLRTLFDLTNYENLTNGMWLTDPDRDTNDLVVFRNGIVDMSQTPPKLMPHTPDFFCQNELSYDYDVNAQCPNWMAFLDSIWDAEDDLKLQLQQWFGYCVSHDVRLQKFGILMGESRGGKGVIADVLTELLGSKNVDSVSLSNLVKDSALHSMSSKSLTVIPDAHNVNQNIRDSVLSNFKAITGGDQIGYHVMYKGQQSAVMRTKIMISTNNMPDFIDPSGALVNRMLVFPFWKSFQGKEDVNLRSKLIGEIAGICQWAIAGLDALRKNNNKFIEANVGLIEKNEIREDMFPLSQYVKEMCKLEPNVFTSLADLYNTYRLWCSMNGIKSPMTQNGFNKTLRNSSLAIRHARVNDERGFYGISTSQNLPTGKVIGFP